MFQEYRTEQTRVLFVHDKIQTGKSTEENKATLCGGARIIVNTDGETTLKYAIRVLIAEVRARRQNHTYGAEFLWRCLD